LIGEVVGIKVDPLKDIEIIGMLDIKKKSAKKIYKKENV